MDDSQYSCNRPCKQSDTPGSEQPYAQAVRVEIRDGVNPQRVVYVRCKGKSDIPLTRIGQPMVGLYKLNAVDP
jgi:hypothetical protein